MPCLAHRCLTRAFWRHNRADAQVTALQEFLNEPFKNKIQTTILDCEMNSKTIYIWTNTFMKFQWKNRFYMFQHEMMFSRLPYSILLQNLIQLLSSTDGNWTVLAVWLGLGLGRRPAFNSRPCFPSEGKGPNWDLGVRTLKLSSEDSEDKLGFWVSRKDHWWTICNCSRPGSPM